MKIKERNITVSIAVILLLGLVLFGSSMMSIISDVEGSNPSCEIDIGGGSCDIYLSLPKQNEISQGYSFDVDFDYVADENFSEPLLLSSFTDGHYVEVGTNDVEDYYLYLYRKPSNWQDVDSIKMTGGITNAYASTSNARVNLRISGGYIKIPYPYNEINYCNEVQVENCDNRDSLLIREYESTPPITFVKEYNMQGVFGNDVLYVSSSTGARTEDVVLNGTNKDVEAFAKDDLVLYAYTLKDISYGTATTRFEMPPTMFVSYKQAHYPTNTKITIGDEEFVVDYPGKITGRQYLPDMATQINNYCGRNDDISSIRECIIPVRFTSEDAGVFTIVSELGNLQDVITEEPITEEPKQNNNDLYILLIGVVLAIIGFVVYSFVKKK